MGLQTGQRLGGFEILGPLGSGGMGEVYRARDTRLGREVALKVLPEALASDRARISRFEQEARAASALNHPNIVTIHEIGREGDTTFVAMELVDGRTLREVSAAGPMPVKKMLNVAAQISEGLAKAHGAGIVHRDLKPENVMVSKDGFVKILDFGLAKLSEPPPGQLSAMPTAVAPQTTAGTVLGTVAYMSPEQASGEPVDYRSDQFSLGSMLYEISTGKKAFQKKTAAETMSAIIREEPEPAGNLRPDLPLPVRWMLDRCMAKDREERYVSTRDLARDLASVRDHISEVTSGSQAMLSATGKPRRRYAQPLVLAALAVGLVAGWALTRARSKPASAAPTLTRLTFRRGGLSNARFGPDGKTIVFGARWAGEMVETKLYRMQIGSPESSPFDFQGDILAISSSNELAVLDMTLGADRERCPAFRCRAERPSPCWNTSDTRAPISRRTGRTSPSITPSTGDRAWSSRSERSSIRTPPGPLEYRATAVRSPSGTASSPMHWRRSDGTGGRNTFFPETGPRTWEPRAGARTAARSGLRRRDPEKPKLSGPWTCRAGNGC